MTNTAFFVTFAGLALAGAMDRFLWRRGKIDIVSLAPAGRQGDYLRFHLTYHAKGRPDWSQLSYQFRDHENPTTVIEGKSRSLNGCRTGINSEYLLIRADKVQGVSKAGASPKRWDLNVRITTTSPRNPLYSLFPFESWLTVPVYIDGEAA